MIDLLLPSLILLIGGLHAVRRLRRPDTINLIDVMIWMTCLFFGTGPWVAWSFGRGKLPEHPVKILLEVYFAIFLFVSGLAISSLLVSGRGNTRAGREGTIPLHSLRLLLLQGEGASIWVILAGFIAGVGTKFFIALTYGVFVTGDLWQRNYQVSNDMSYTISALFVTSLIAWKASFIGALAGLFHRPRRHVVIGSTVVVTTFLLDFTLGRRVIIADTFLLILCWLLLRGMSLRLFFGMACLIAVVGYLAVPFFWSVRYYRGRLSTQTSAVYRFVHAVGDAITDWDKAAREQGYARNMSQRTLTMELNCAIASGLEDNSPTYGELIWSSAVTAIPYVLYPDKRLVSQPEPILAAHFHYPDIDMADNWTAYGMAEGGPIFGPLLFGFLLGMILQAVQRFAVAVGWRMPFIAMCVVGVVYDVAVSVETTPIPLFGSLRDLFLLITPFLLFYPFLRPKLPRALAAAAYSTEDEPDAYPPSDELLQWNAHHPVEHPW